MTRSGWSYVADRVRRLSQPCVDAATPDPPSRGRRPTPRQTLPPGSATAETPGWRRPRRRGRSAGIFVALFWFSGAASGAPGEGMPENLDSSGLPGRAAMVGATWRDEGRALPLSKPWATDSRLVPTLG